MCKRTWYFVRSVLHTPVTSIIVTRNGITALDAILIRSRTGLAERGGNRVKRKMENKVTPSTISQAKTQDTDIKDFELKRAL